MRYFDHDAGAAGDPKMLQLVMACGPAAGYAYWVALEMLYRDETGLVFPEDGGGNRPGFRDVTKAVSMLTATDAETVRGWFSTMVEIGLFHRVENDPDTIVSDRAMGNMRAYKEKQETARQNGKRGGRKPTRKPTGLKDKNQPGSDAETQPLANKRKERVLGTHKGYPNTPSASGGAAAAGAAPASAQGADAPAAAAKCPECGSRLTATGVSSTGWWCDSCNDERHPVWGEP